MPRRISKCPCGRCQSWHVEPEAAIQGVDFSKRQAEAAGKLLDALDLPAAEGKYLVVEVHTAFDGKSELVQRFHLPHSELGGVR